jgi:ubiquitin fusion degradation protein 1
MMQNLLLSEGDMITIKNVSLPKANFVKFQPQSASFMEDIMNPKAVLEFALRKFSCVTLGDHLCIDYNDTKYYLEVKEVKPADAACIIETDCETEFDNWPGYVAPKVGGRRAVPRASRAFSRAPMCAW